MRHVGNPAIRWTDKAKGGLARRRVFETLEPVRVGFESADGPTFFTVPAGFEFDFASIPPIATVFIRPDSVGVGPPLVHDWLYANRGQVMTDDGVLSVSRKQADDLFLELMLGTGVPKWKAGIMHRAVRIGGAGGWGS